MQQPRAKCNEPIFFSPSNSADSQTQLPGSSCHERRADEPAIEPHPFGDLDLASIEQPSLTVITPSLLTFSVAWTLRFRTWTSPFVEMAATCAISAVVFMVLVLAERKERTRSTVAWEPRGRCMGLQPAATFLTPSA